MKNWKKHITANLQKLKAVISFSILLFTVFFAACSTPTISSDDSDEKSSVETAEQGEDLSFAVEQKEEMFNPDIDYGSMTDERDGQVYRTVTIGDQVWMAENLNYASAEGSSCNGNTAGGCARYGRLYTWVAAVGKAESACGEGHECDLGEGNVQGVCPEGWHLPTNPELKTLFNTVGGQTTAGKALKSQTGWYSSDDGTDAFGFSAVSAGGARNNKEDHNAYFWSSTEFGSNNGCRMTFYYNSSQYDKDAAYLGAHKKSLMSSVRCVKD
ncbi:MAG: fibrobacter succinogenes major paralogous domain-containing protein [Fibrobacter sp.]|nr:fibrobacter succinogenes major paralogous domain-containing protein [Fibrobacter sp.]